LVGEKKEHDGIKNPRAATRTCWRGKKGQESEGVNRPNTAGFW